MTRISEKVNAGSLYRLLEKQKFKCAYSGRELKPNNSQLDHIIPLSKGGSHDIDNCAIVTSEVNKAKGVLSLDEFIEMCKSVASHAETSQTSVGEPA